MPEEPSLTVQDLVDTLKFIDIACSRGVVRGEELQAVATLRSRYSTIVDTFKNSEEKPEGAPAAEQAPAAEPAAEPKSEETDALDGKKADKASKAKQAQPKPARKTRSKTT